jgi:hypothetical protein
MPKSHWTSIITFLVCTHRVHILLSEGNPISLVFQNIDPPSPSPPGESVPPATKAGGVHTRRAVRGMGGQYFGRREKQDCPLTVKYVLCVCTPPCPPLPPCIPPRCCEPHGLSVVVRLLSSLQFVEDSLWLYIPTTTFRPTIYYAS